MENSASLRLSAFALNSLYCAPQLLFYDTAGITAGHCQKIVTTTLAYQKQLEFLKMIDLTQTTAQFLKDHCKPDQPVLLGLSGGPDSLCLFYALLECKASFQIAHVDHAWREESQSESLELRALADRHGIPFHEKRLDPSSLIGNLEAACRLERYRFFKEICNEYHCQGVLVAHHADDQVETVLKRLFEGASWANLKGLGNDVKVEGVRVLRPFLNATKQDIFDDLEKRELRAFDDQTNLDPRFLRGKMRTSIIPLLSREFGKDIKSSICAIGQEAKELQEYFDLKIEKYAGRVVESKLGFYLDLSIDCPESPIELKYLVRKICVQASISIPRLQLEQIVNSLLQKQSNIHIPIGKKAKKLECYVDRRRLFILKEMPTAQAAPISLCPGIHTFGDWIVEVSRIAAGSLPASTSWKEAWEGRLEVVLPMDNYILAMPQTNAAYYLRSSKINKWWTDHKVPTFIRSLVPVIWLGDDIYHEFLTGLVLKLNDQKQDLIRISISLKD